MKEELIKSFNHLREFGFEYFSLRNIRLMRLTDKEWEVLINKMNNLYGTGLTRSDLNEVFSTNNIDFVREWLGKPSQYDEKYPKYYLLTSQVKKKKLYVSIPDSQVDEEVIMDEDFLGCNPQYLGLKKPSVKEDIEDITWIELTAFRYDEEEMWNKYNIPTYVIDEICRQVLDPDGKLDYYETPDTFALNQMNINVELNGEDHKNINKFVSTLKEKMPEGFNIVWDEESCGSPYFHPCPEFGKPMECVILRVYPKNLDRLKA